MKSFMGRDILSLKAFERNEFFRVFEVAKALEPICQEPPQQRPAQGQDAGDGLLPAVHAHSPGARSRHAPAGRTRDRLFDAKMSGRGLFIKSPSKTRSRCSSSMGM